MPRDPSGVYTKPFPNVQPDTTVESTVYNGFVGDVETDLNAARPVIAGGTGATNATQARANLQAEVSTAIVVNYDSQIWEPGSFYSASTATNPPVAGHRFAGIVYGPDANNLVIEARDLDDTAVPGIVYVKEKSAGVWAPAWTTELAGAYVAKIGDTMSGNLTIARAGPGLILNSTDAQAPTVLSQRSGVFRWRLDMGANAESTGNAGSDWQLSRYNDAGIVIDSPLTVNRQSGRASILSNPVNPLEIVPKQYVDTFAAPFDALAFNGMQLNGTFDVSQQFGTSGVAVPSNTGFYVPDQWIATIGGGGVVINAVVTNAALAGFGNAFRIVSTTGGPLGGTASDIASIYSPIEGYRIQRLGWGTASAQPITVGIYIFVSIPGKLSLTITNFDASRSYLTAFNVIAGYQYLTVTIPGDTAGTWKIDNGVGMQVRIGSLCGTSYQSASVNVWGTGYRLCTPDTTNFFATNNNVISIACVGVWPGNYAPPLARLPFVMRPKDTELPLCQRHYQLVRPEFRVFTSGVGQIYETFISYNSTMRVAATLALLDATGASSSNNFSSFALQDFGGIGFRILAIPNTAGEMYYNGYTYAASARL